MEAKGYHILNSTVMIQLFKEVEAVRHNRKRQFSVFTRALFILKKIPCTYKCMKVVRSSKSLERKLLDNHGIAGMIAPLHFSRISRTCFLWYLIIYWNAVETTAAGINLARAIKHRVIVSHIFWFCGLLRSVLHVCKASFYCPPAPFRQRLELLPALRQVRPRDPSASIFKTLCHTLEL